MREIYLAGGCFWGVQRYFDQFDGIVSTETGYANGSTEAPSYEDVCAGSGHAETVKIVYDETATDLVTILGYYFRVIDPLSVNRQGHDIGVQYRTGIYYVDDADLQVIDEEVEKVSREYGAPLAVEVRRLESFYPAEEYHQKYLDKNPGGYCHIPWELMNISGSGQNV